MGATCLRTGQHGQQRRLSMRLNHLEVFLEAVRRESFSQAAQAMGISQATVSKYVAALERWLGAPLFLRQGRRVVPTEAARRLVPLARQMLLLAQQARQVVASPGEQLRGVLHLAASSVPAESLLPECLAAFSKQYPQVEVSLAVSDSRQATAQVLAGEAELGVVGEVEQEERLQYEEIAQDELVLIVAPEHPLARSRTASLEEVLRWPLIVRESGSGSRRCVEAALRQAGVAPRRLKVALEVNANEAIRRAVAQGAGVAFQSQAVIRQEVRDGLLVPVRIRHFRPRRLLYAIWRRGQELSAPAREFLRFIKRSGCLPGGSESPER